MNRAGSLGRRAAGVVPFDGVLFTGMIDAVGPLDDDNGAMIAVGHSQNIHVVVSVDSVLQGDAPFGSGDVVTFGVERWSMLPLLHGRAFLVFTSQPNVA